ncbi:hypothetical protein CANCADRAFT_82001 [Tortispora caseinolytica NRRL Y-17796]|uniref:Aromatic-L-amino-acid decarboxylase n=1 Tax=Tortispora caseinolytica NRRL Y-17796 TaxID=767744 RepID=A0A1E4TK13_9ASCO|nr:hypothetical protein CANCADRAFT_82001 [Tortispora caseinolytica NRRL Y-17796]
MDAEEFRKAAYESIDKIVDYYKNLGENNTISSVEPGYLKALLPEQMPNEGESWDAVKADLDRAVIPGLTNWQSPNFFAFFPANSSYPAMLGEMFSTAFTGAAFSWICSPVVTEMETIVLDWLAKAIGLPESFLSRGTGGGVIQGSASEAAIVAVVAARERYIQESKVSGQEESDLRGKLVAICSDNTHSSTEKAAKIAGVHLHKVPTDPKDNYRLRGAPLRKAFQDLKAQGLVPFFVCASIGTTTICGFDAIDEVGSVCKETDSLIWLHIDAAYGGAALICEEYKDLLKGIEYADSFDMNMHKWMLVNFDCSCMFVQQRTNLTDHLTLTPSYLRNDATDSGLVIDYKDWQLPLGRRFRSLKMWMTMRMYGVEGFKNHIRRSVKQAELFNSLISSNAQFRIVTEPRLALVCFQVFSKSGEDITKTVADTLNAGKKYFVTYAVTSDGKGILRVVTGSPQTQDEHVKSLYNAILELI